MLHLYALFEEYIHILYICAVYIRLGVHPVCMGGTGFPAGRTMVDSCRLGGVSYPPHTHTNFCSACYTGCKLKHAWCLHCGGGSASSKSKGDVIIMKKRLISFLLALSMMLSLVPAGAFAAEVQNLVSARKPSTARRLPAGVWNRA